MDLDFLVEAVKNAGDFAKVIFDEGKYYKSHEFDSEIKKKGVNELVLQEDIICEEIIISKILEHDERAIIYSEEKSNINELEKDESDIKYLIDPLDGTHNYYFGIPFWGIAVSVLDSRNIPNAAVIYLPEMDILMKCESIFGSTLIWNEHKWEKITTNPKKLSQALICYDNQFYKLGKQALKLYEHLTHHCFTTRITGSAVCDAAFIACGRVNARIWNNTNSYDIGAGIRIVEGANGKVSDFHMNSVNVISKQVIMCSDEILQSELIKITSLV